MQKILGFSLIELMIVIVIIGVLTTIAIPSYQLYTTRAHFAEVVAATAPYKTAIALDLQQGMLATDLMINTNGIPEAPLPTKNLKDLTVENGIITATGTDIAGGATFILTPNNDGTLWTITGSCLAAGLCNF